MRVCNVQTAVCMAALCRIPEALCSVDRVVWHSSWSCVAPGAPSRCTCGVSAALFDDLCPAAPGSALRQSMAAHGSPSSNAISPHNSRKRFVRASLPTSLPWLTWTWPQTASAALGGLPQPSSHSPLSKVPLRHSPRSRLLSQGPTRSLSWPPRARSPSTSPQSRPNLRESSRFRR